ncbi:MAG: murein biosynthesis integral membrane protein MurJ [Beijerinckiaceae bacterium]|nr:murein biosynthesis integral membrane protein MurJ [Beijerinckiaceae bacterium]
MIRAFVSVSLWTLLSRVTGFVRDILLARLLGAGLMMDAFAVAFRLPNHFRAIFGEGAFSSAFVPAYTRIRTQAGDLASRRFQGEILTLMLIAQGLLLALVLLFTPGFIRLLAPGFAASGQAMGLAVELTRITFPYLALVSLVVLWTGVLNAEKRFVAGAAAPVLLNLAMISTLLLAGFFASGAHAAAWGVLLAGVLEAGLLIIAAMRAGLLAPPVWPRWNGELARFFRAFGPAVIGSAGVQIAMLADTILVTFLPAGGASSLYYADRVYQLPIGVIGVAAGTVLLPEMAKRLAAGDETGAHKAQNQSLAISLMLAIPFTAAFLVIPQEIIRGFFGYGAFGEDAVRASAAVLAAYACGLPAVVAIRSLVASFHARGDTRTPLYASLTAIALNLGLKLLLWRDYGAAGLAFATALGAIANALILGALAIRQKKAGPDAELALQLAIAVIGTIWLIATLLLVREFAGSAFAALPAFAKLAVLTAAGIAAYGGILLFCARLAKLSLRFR